MALDLTLLKEQLVRHEGLRLKPYKDTVGKLTIGVGRNLDDIGINEQEAMFMLNQDLIRVMVDLDRDCPWWRGITDARQMVLADMCFNLGIARLLGFKNTLAAMKERRYEEAAKEMIDSKWAQQVGRRAITLAEMMKNG